MTITDVSTDLPAARFVVVAEYAATVDRVWQLWADPRLLEQWWGPPGYPATVTAHDLSEGGLVRYHMTGPEGEQYHGGWRVRGAKPPHRLELEDYFADAEGNEDTGLPVSATIVTITERADGITEMVLASEYPTPDDLKKVFDMGMEDGIRAAIGQIDGLLTDYDG